MDGVLRCSRYAFGPNRLHYCGPDANKEMLAHIAEQKGDAGLTGILSRFETMYPYLELIAHANGVRDPFDDAVVEAYWIGNPLLDRIGKEKLYWHLKDDQSVRSRLGARSREVLDEALQGVSVPHHAFHVLRVWQETRRASGAHTPEEIAECIVNIGEVTEVSGPWITVRTRPLLCESVTGQWYFGEACERRLVRNLGQSEEIDDVTAGDTLSYHWGVPCEVLTPLQAEHLRRYTMLSVEAVNGK